jgi:hypothetical protein
MGVIEEITNIECELDFPELLLMSQYGGSFKEYFDAVYEVFKVGFIDSKPLCNGVQVGVQKFPLVDGIHRTFYHITHEGEDESNRTPDLRRMERISFPRFIIDNIPNRELLVWKNTRGRDARILIFNEAEEYLVVLTERKDYYLFWTAYVVEQEHNKRKLRREYEAYKKTNTA